MNEFCYGAMVVLPQKWCRLSQDLEATWSGQLRWAGHEASRIFRYLRPHFTHFRLKFEFLLFKNLLFKICFQKFAFQKFNCFYLLYCYNRDCEGLEMVLSYLNNAQFVYQVTLIMLRPCTLYQVFLMKLLLCQSNKI